jgi:hypothetical protein
MYCMNFVPIDSVASSASQIKDELPQLRRRPFADLGRSPAVDRVEIHSCRNRLSFGAWRAEQARNSPLRRARQAFAPTALLLQAHCEDVFYQALAKHLSVEFIDSPVDVSASGVAAANAATRDPGPVDRYLGCSRRAAAASFD